MGYCLSNSEFSFIEEKSYNGVFIVLSILWGWGVDRETPDLYDWMGAAVCIIGASIILFAPRQNKEDRYGIFLCNKDSLSAKKLLL